MIVSLGDVKQWMRVDEDYEDGIIQDIINAAEDYLGEDIDKTNPKAKILMYALCTDWYEHRELIGAGPSENVRYSIQSLKTQLQYGGEKQ